VGYVISLFTKRRFINAIKKKSIKY